MKGIYLLTYAAVLCAVATAQLLKNCNNTLDLVFVVDGSNSVDPVNFDLIVRSLRNSVNSLAVGGGNTRVGVVTYGTGLWQEIPITGDKPTLLQDISKLTWPDGGTDTHLAIDWARTQLTAGRRSDVPRAIVVLTDGESSYVTKTREASEAAKREGILMYAVGVGSLVNSAELTNITAPHADRVFLMDDFLELNQKLDSITVEVCEAACSKGVDMVFVLDGSNSVFWFNFQNLLKAVANTAVSFWAKHPQSRVAVITYATGVYQTVGLTQGDDQTQFTQDVLALEYPDGGTTTAEAIVAASTVLRANQRAGIPRVIVVITDGESDDANKTTAAALNSKNEGNILFAIGVGPAVDKSELDRIASAPSLSTEVSDFNILSQQLDYRIAELCGPATTVAPMTTTPKNEECTKGVDMVFVLDGSNSVFWFNFQNLLKAVANTTVSFWAKHPQSRVAVITYATGVYQTVGLTLRDDKTQFTQAVLNLEFPDGGTTTAEAIAAASDLLRANRREGIPRVIVVITDGESDDPQRTTAAATAAKSAGDILFAIGVGPAVDKSELDRIASAPSLSTEVSDFNILSQQLDYRIAQLCEKQTTPLTTTTPLITTTTQKVPTTTLAPVTTTSKNQECTEGVDMVFVLDGSNSVFWFNFQNLLKAVANATVSFWAKHPQSRVAVITYATGVYETVGLTQRDDKTQFTQAVLALQYPDGGTTTAEAIVAASNVLRANQRAGIPRVIVVITDGESDDANKTTAAALNAKNEGNILFAIGVGPAVDKSELDRIASAPSLSTEVSDFNILSQQLDYRIAQLCEKQTTPLTTTTTPLMTTTPQKGTVECTKGVDMVFVLDGSNSVFWFNFQNLLKAVANTAVSFWAKHPQSRVAVITYATGVYQTVDLTQRDDKTQFTRDVLNLEYPDGGTTTAEAIVAANNVMRANQRAGIPRVIVVITDGESDDANKTTAAALNAKNEGNILFAIGVGPSVDKSELDRIASAPSLSTEVSDFNILSQQLDYRIAQLCDEATTTTTAPLITTTPYIKDECTNGVDMVFLLDGSNSVLQPNFQNLLTTVSTTTTSFWNRHPHSRLAVITYATGVYQTVPLAYQTQEAAFKTAVTGLQFPDGGTSTDEAIIAGNNMLRADQRGVPRVIVVITDGQSDETSYTTAAAQTAKDEGVILFAIGVGPAVDKSELDRIASAPSLSTEVSDFNILSQQLDSRIANLCGTTVAPTTPPPFIRAECSKPMDLVFVVDGSNDVGQNNFQALKTALRHAALYYVINAQNTRVGVINYATSVTGGFPLSADRDAVDNGIRGLKYTGGSRATGVALDAAFAELERGQRSNVPKVVLLVTSGNSDSPTRTEAAAMVLKRYGSYLYTLGVSSAVSNAEMNLTTNNDPTHQFRAVHYGFVQSQLLNMVRMICSRDCRRALDVVFVVDGSNSVNPFNFELMVNSLNSSINSLPVGPESTRVGVVTYGTGLSQEINVTTDVADLRDAISSLTWPDGGTDTHLAIDWARAQLTAGRRSDVPRAIVVLTDGVSSYVTKTREASEAAKREGILMYAVGVGELVDREELSNITAPATDRVFLNDRFEDLTHSLQNITAILCM